MSFNDMVAQLAHFSWGALLTDSLAARIKPGLAIALVTSFFVGKEVIESVWGAWEPVQPWSSALEDMAFWALGVLVGILLLKYAWKRPV